MKARETSLQDRLSASNEARRAQLERARANDPTKRPEFIQQQEARRAANAERERKAAERKALEKAAAEKAAAEKAAADAERQAREAAEAAAREAALEIERKAARDARYAARKGRSK
ncbi:MAG: hypothetical protein IPK81_18285 [Rhodospirillales bacterium]|nr:MAG: hypothetical protein IPK81_18285 [Rhodospirillales bacterium]